MKQRFLRIVSVALIFAVLLGSVNVFAAESSEKDNYSELEHAFTKMNEIAEMSTVVTDIEKIDALKNFVKNAVDNNEILLHFDKSNLNYNEAKVMDIVNEDRAYTAITVPMVNENYAFLSNVTVILDKNQIITYSESLITKSENNKFIINTYSDGVLVESNHTDIDYVSDTELQAELQAIHENIEKGNQYLQTRGLGAVAGCIAGAIGVNGTIAYLVAATCVTACTAAPIGGAVCAACIGGVFVLGAADVAVVAACFSLKD